HRGKSIVRESAAGAAPLPPAIAGVVATRRRGRFRTAGAVASRTRIRTLRRARGLGPTRALGLDRERRGTTDALERANEPDVALQALDVADQRVGDEGHHDAGRSCPPGATRAVEVRLGVLGEIE